MGQALSWIGHHVVFKLLVIAQVFAFLMALGTLVLATWLGFSVLIDTTKPINRVGVPTTVVREESVKFNLEIAAESVLQQGVAEQRTAAVRSIGMVVGIGVLFLALSLLLGAFRTVEPPSPPPSESAGDDEPSPSKSGTGDGNSPFGSWVARLAPGLVTLVCGTVIVAVAIPGTKSGLPSGPISPSFQYTSL